jgi:hypothetical protein
MWRVLETELRKLLTGHEGGNAGHSQGTSYGFTRQRSTLPPRTPNVSIGEIRLADIRLSNWLK